MGFSGLVCFRKPYFTRKALLSSPVFGEGIVITEVFLIVGLIAGVSSIIIVVPPILKPILIYPLGVASLVVLLIPFHYVLSKFFIYMSLKQISQHVEYIGSTEIPVVKQTLVPYDLQVEGSVADLSTQAWALELMQGQNLTRRNFLLFHLLKQWLIGVNPNDVDQETTLSVSDTLVRLEPQNAWAHLRRGITHDIMKEYEAALGDFNQAIKLDPNDISAIVHRGITYRSMQQNEKALSDFKRAIELNPIETWAIVHRGITYGEMEQYEQALHDFNQAIEINPIETWAIANRGISYARLEQYEQALDDFNRVIGLDPNYVWAIASRGITCRLMEQYEEALDNFNRAIELDPNNAQAIGQRGITYRIMERYQEALDDFNRAIELNPNDTWAIAHRSVTYRLMEQYKEALSDLNRAIELDPSYTWAIAQRGQVYLLMRQCTEALADLNQAIQLEPKDDWYLFLRACTLSVLGKQEEAANDFKAAIHEAKSVYETKPQLWSNTFDLALYHLVIREAERAEQIYRQAFSKGAPPGTIRVAWRDLNLLLHIMPDTPQGHGIKSLLEQNLKLTGS